MIISMPELPEVETIVRDLNGRLKGRKLARIELLDKKVFQPAGGSMKSILGAAVKAVKRRGKMLIFDLNGRFILVHLKMTGQLVLKTKTGLIAGGHPIAHESKELPNKFTRAVFKFDRGAVLYFNDVRKFGWIKPADAETLAGLAGGMGVEPLSRDFSLEKFKEILSHKKKSSVKQALQDQKYLSGLGNIYSDEVLFTAAVRPARRVETLKPEEIKKLWLAVPRILKYAIKHRGTSFSDYVDAQGEAGNFIKFLKVYGRAGEKCRRCGGRIRKIKLGGRGAHWCDACQK